MQYYEFLNRIQEVANLDSQDEAIKFSRVVLSTLEERIYHTRRDSLSAQLPDELKEMLRARTEPETTARMLLVSPWRSSITAYAPAPKLHTTGRLQ